MRHVQKIRPEECQAGIGYATPGLQQKQRHVKWMRDADVEKKEKLAGRCVATASQLNAADHFSVWFLLSRADAHARHTPHMEMLITSPWVFKMGISLQKSLEVYFDQNYPIINVMNEFQDSIKG